MTAYRADPHRLWCRDDRKSRRGCQGDFSWSDYCLTPEGRKCRGPPKLHKEHRSEVARETGRATYFVREGEAGEESNGSHSPSKGKRVGRAGRQRGENTCVDEDAR